MSGIPTSCSAQQVTAAMKRLDHKLGHWAKAAKREVALIDQASRTVVVEGYKIRPAIGRTGRADNVGWELIAPPDCGPDWYLATREEAIEAIPRHRARYGSPL